MYRMLKGPSEVLAEQSPGGGAAPTLSELMCKDRYQISVAIGLAVCIPIIVRGLAVGVDLTMPMQYNTVAGIVVAIVLGYLGFKNINIFPGITSGGYIATSITLSFLLVAAIFLLLRLQYTTIQLAAGYVVSMAYLVSTHVFLISKKVIRLGIIPSCATERLPKGGRVQWYPISAPDGWVPRLDGVVVDLNADHSDAWNNRIANFVLDGVPVYHFKAAIENLIGQVEIEHLSENTLGSLNPNDLYLALKGGADRIAAALILVLLSPVLLLIAAMIALDSGGPVFFRQERVGFRKKTFRVCKFRTMYHAPKAGDARQNVITLENDPRITRVGRLLRKGRLDELPQLLNVIRGEMSLIGPRPEALPLVEWYEKEIPFYHYRHIIKPGITGWAQVNQGHVADVSDVIRKLHLDFYYVKNFSFWLDFYIALKTVLVMVRGAGAK